MSLRALALDWSVDGPIGVTFLVFVLALAILYLLAAEQGRRRDRRGRRWPPTRTACFLAGLTILVVDLYSGIGTEADARLSVHMLEHMIVWLVVAPLLAGGAPVRLALFALPRRRRALGRCLRSRPVALGAGPVGSVVLFSAVLLISHLPTVYGLTLRNEYVHEAEHGLFLLTAVLVWAPLLRVDPLPHRPGPRGRLACMAVCMMPMVLIAVWLGTAAHPLYDHYVQTTGTAALDDQRAAAAIMWTACLPAFAAPLLRRARIPQEHRSRQPVRPPQSAV